LAINTLLPVSIALALRPWGMSWAASIIGPGLLLQSDSSPLLGSCMQDLPAVSLGAASIIPLVLLGNHPRIASSLSALIAGFAMVFKPTAAFGCLLLLTHLGPETWIRYGVATVVAFLGVSVACGSDMIRAAASHSYSGPGAQRYALDLAGLLMSSPGFVAVCLVGATAAFFLGPSKLVFGLSGALALIILIHLAHRPYWAYYAPHIAVPILVLTGVGIVSAVKQRNAVVFSSAVLLLGGAAIVSFPSVVRIIQSGTTMESRAGFLIRNQVGRIHSVISEDPWCPLAAGVAPLHETVMVPAKRHWIGDWTPNDAALAIRDRVPEVVVLWRATSQHRSVRAMLRPYRYIGEYQGMEVFTSTNLPPVNLPKNDLKILGL
jgi:hypothetical protein